MVSAVSDSDVLIHFAKLDLLYLLKEQFSRIYLSDIIYNESVIQGISLQKADAYLLKDFIRLDLFIIEKVNKKLIGEIKNKYNIHEGECSIIVLAKKYKVDYCLTNEIKVRTTIKAENLNVVGTLGLIIKAYDRSQIDKNQVLTILKRIQNRSNEFRFHPKLIESTIVKLFGK